MASKARVFCSWRGRALIARRDHLGNPGLIAKPSPYPCSFLKRWVRVRKPLLSTHERAAQRVQLFNSLECRPSVCAHIRSISFPALEQRRCHSGRGSSTAATKGGKVRAAQPFRPVSLAQQARDAADHVSSASRLPDKVPGSWTPPAIGESATGVGSLPAFSHQRLG